MVGWLKEAEGVSQRTYMNDHGHKQWCKDGLWERGAGWVEGDKEGNIGTTVRAQTIKYLNFKKVIIFLPQGLAA